MGLSCSNSNRRLLLGGGFSARVGSEASWGSGGGRAGSAVDFSENWQVSVLATHSLALQAMFSGLWL